MSALDYSMINHRNVDSFVNGFLERKETKDHIKIATKLVVQRLEDSWKTRCDSSLNTEPFNRRFIVQNEDRYYTSFSRDPHISLDTTLHIDSLVYSYWRTCDFFNAPGQKPCKFREFKKLCYHATVKKLNEHVTAHFAEKGELEITCHLRPKGYYIPEHRFNHTSGLFIGISLSIPVLGWLWLLMPDSVRPLFSGGIQITYQGTPITGGRPSKSLYESEDDLIS